MKFPIAIKSKQQFPPVPLTWEKSSAPSLPISLPIGVEISITNDSIQVHAKREGSIAADEEEHLNLAKEDVLSVLICLKPDIEDDADWGWIRTSNLSSIRIRHRDPFEVVPFFESTFTSGKSYWPKALAKALLENLDLKAEITEEAK